MANQIYDNFFLANRLEDQYLTKLNLQAFATIDNSLEGTAGMEFHRNTYSATDGIEELEMGAGNTKQIETKLAEDVYKIKLAQVRFKYYDEELLTDPIAIEKGIDHIAEEMFNHVNSDVIAEFGKATNAISASAPNFDAFVDAVASLNLEVQEGTGAFALISPADVAKVRKSLKDSLQYVEAFVRTGYIGTVAGVSLFVTKAATENTIVGGTSGAVTVFNKKGMEVEQVTNQNRGNDDTNTRTNWIYGRKYYLAQITDPDKAFKITLGE